MKDLNLTKYFIATAEAKKDIIHLLVVIAVYVVANWLVGILFGLISWLPIVGWLLKLIKIVIRVYLGLGVLVALLAFLKVVK
ncbi:MAG: hypothetical protein ACI4WG_00395 [Erysipelotrichaceae bacterium]